MRILCVGDIYGRPGRRVASSVIPALRAEEQIDFVIANGENVAGGFGITMPILRKLRRYGIDCVTSGNHIWDKKEIGEQMDDIPDLLRPANYPESSPGVGGRVFQDKIGVINVSGKTLMPRVDCPFRRASEEIEKLGARMVIVDFHAESAAEKKAFALWLDGRVSGIFGTHTHVQTADEQVLPKGTAYITDVGMTGSFDSVIGVKPDRSIDYFVYGIPQRFDASKNDEHLNGVILDIDEESGKTMSIKRINV
jgi:metallophosphoesterase (TIGR00282 family)